MTVLCVHGKDPLDCDCRNAEPLPREALPPIPPTMLATSPGHDACDRRIADLEAQLAARSHEAIVARAEAELAKGILRKLRAFGARTERRLLVRSTRGPIPLTDAEAALFDTITEESK